MALKGSNFLELNHTLNPNEHKRLRLTIVLKNLEVVLGGTFWTLGGDGGQGEINSYIS